jgi:hypothetical protein
MRSKRDMTWQRGDVGWRRGDTRRGKGGDDASWAEANFSGPKNKENPHSRFSCYKWTVKI